MTVGQVAYADSLNSTVTDLFEDQGYVVIRGLLDEGPGRPAREGRVTKP